MKYALCGSEKRRVLVLTIKVWDYRIGKFRNDLGSGLCTLRVHTTILSFQRKSICSKFDAIAVQSGTLSSQYLSSSVIYKLGCHSISRSQNCSKYSRNLATRSKGTSNMLTTQDPSS